MKLFLCYFVPPRDNQYGGRVPSIVSWHKQRLIGQDTTYTYLRSAAVKRNSFPEECLDTKLISPLSKLAQDETFLDYGFP